MISATLLFHYGYYTIFFRFATKLWKLTWRVSVSFIYWTFDIRYHSSSEFVTLLSKCIPFWWSIEKQNTVDFLNGTEPLPTNSFVHSIVLFEKLTKSQNHIVVKRQSFHARFTDGHDIVFFPCLLTDLLLFVPSNEPAIIVK